MPFLAWTLYLFMKKIFTFFLLFILQKGFAQYPFTYTAEASELRYSNRQPVISYVLRVDEKDLCCLFVEMRLSGVASTFRLAMFVHPEYDDRYFRYVEALQVETKEGPATVQREKNTCWRIAIKGSEATVRYRLRLPAQSRERSAWRPLLSANGGLIGGPQCYMYVVGAEHVPCSVQLNLPETWKVATGLPPAARAREYLAATADALFDAPILVGHFREWVFFIDGVPHQVAYFSSQASTFDTARLVTGIKKIVEQAVALFGRLPYRDYHFLLQDESYGALEHANSVTVGVPSSALAKDMDEYLSEIAHEYFHAWNLVRIRPAHYPGIDYRPPSLSKGLWWSEGLTMFFTDLLLRRAGLTAVPRTEHLRGLLQQYFESPANHLVSAERLSMAAYAPPGYLGNMEGSTHLQGELIGTMLDLLIRSRSNNRQSIDDVMRAMNERFSGPKGFTNADVASLIHSVTGVSVEKFFSDHIYGSKPIGFNRYLRLAGLQYTVRWKEAKEENGKTAADLRVYAYRLPDSPAVCIGITQPNGCWARAGLHSGDIILAIDGKPIGQPLDFFQQIHTAKPGDRLQVSVIHEHKTLSKTVLITGYRVPEIAIEELAGMDRQTDTLKARWMRAQ